MLNVGELGAMKTRWLVGSYVALLVAGCGPGSTEPVLLQSEAPPPAWTRPKNSGLPDAFLDAAAFILEHGAADPRGGRLVVAESDGHRYVGWLVKDRLAAVDGLAYGRATELKPARSADVISYLAAAGTANPWLSQQKNVLAAAMAAVAGDAALAKRLYVPAPNLSPFQSVAYAYIMSRTTRSYTESEAGDDRAAYADLAALQLERAAFEAEAAKHWVAEPGHPQPPKTYFAQLADLDASAARLAYLAKLQTLPPERRTAKLIEALAKAKVTGWSNPGGPMLFGIPEVDALVSQGRDAIGQLVDAYADDKRLTVNPIPSRMPGQRPVGFLPVRALVYAALQRSEMFVNLGTHGTPPSPEDVRSWWAKVKGKTPPQAWALILEDDRADPRAWLAAAQYIVDPVGTERIGFGYRSTSPTDDTPPALKGEALRPLRNPSVTDLMTKRARELTHLTTGNSNHWFEMSYAMALAIDLQKWDRAHSLSLLQEVTRAFASDPLAKAYGSMTMSSAGAAYGAAISARITVGDRSALAEYGDWLERLPDTNGLFGNESRVFGPLLLSQRDPRSHAIAKRLFEDPRSPWNTTALVRSGSRLLASPLLGFSEFRSGVLTALHDPTVLGEASRDGSMVSTPTIGYNLGPDFKPAAGSQAKEKTSFRVCDAVAVSLRMMEDIPAFQPFWPVEKRNAALGQIRDYLTKNASRIDDLLNWPDDWKEQPDFAKMQRRAAEAAAHAKTPPPAPLRN